MNRDSGIAVRFAPGPLALPAFNFCLREKAPGDSRPDEGMPRDSISLASRLPAPRRRSSNPITFNNVFLSEPEGPISATNSPSWILRQTCDRTATLQHDGAYVSLCFDRACVSA